VDINGKLYLTESDLHQHSIWVEHQSDDLHYPVNSTNDLPEDMRPNDLSIRAKFTTPNKLIFNGYIIGIKNIFCIVIFWNNEIIYLNKNLLSDCIDSIDKISLSLSQKVDAKKYFPMRYETTIDIEGFKNLCGEFDIFQERTNDERF